MTQALTAVAGVTLTAIVDAGPVTVGTCGCSNNFGHTCEEVARLRADNATMRDLLAKAFPWIDPNESHDDYLLTVAIREALGEGS